MTSSKRDLLATKRAKLEKLERQDLPWSEMDKIWELKSEIGALEKELGIESPDEFEEIAPTTSHQRPADTYVLLRPDHTFVYVVAGLLLFCVISVFWVWQANSCPDWEPACWSDEEQQKFIDSHNIIEEPDGLVATPKY